MRQRAPLAPSTPDRHSSGLPARRGKQYRNGSRALRSAVRVVVTALLVLPFAGCGEEGVTSSTLRSRIAVKDLPEPILAAAKKELTGFEIQDAFENRENGKTLQSYEIRARNKRGKISEVRVSLEGKILERE